MTITEDGVAAWMARWAEAIRANDFETGRAMFANDVVAFGSLTRAMQGIDALLAEQWQPVWPETRDFAFERPAMLRVTAEMAVVAAEWRSEGRSADGWYERRGRAMLVLLARDGALICVHSHVSMLPGTQALAKDAAA